MPSQSFSPVGSTSRASLVHRSVALPVSKHFEEHDATMAESITYNQIARRREATYCHIIAAEPAEPLAKQMVAAYPDRFTFHSTKWSKFSDGTDNIEIGGFYPRNLVSGDKHVLFIASFHKNDVTLSQFRVMICLLQSFIESLTVVLPYYPVGTIERVVRDG